MKRINIFKSVIIAAAACAAAGCSDWMTPETEAFDEYSLTEVAKDDAYYAALRAYKESDHAIAFGWYDGWGEPGLSTSRMLSAVPDSMDIISLWDNSRGISPEQKEDLRFVQDVKGTKVTVCFFASNVGNSFTPPEYTSGNEGVTLDDQKAFWGWEDGNDEAIRSSLAKYAAAIRDTIDFYGYDGIDIDYEPGGSLDQNMTYFTWFVQELGKYFGPKSGTDQLLIIDGYVNRLAAEIGPYCNYLVSQAYSVPGGTPPTNCGMTADQDYGTYMSGNASLQTRLNQVINTFSSTLSEEEVTNKFVVTDNLESAIDCLNGGYYWTDDQGRTWSKSVMPSLVGFASWNPDNDFRKGGFGGYRFSNERSNTPMFKWMRRAIQQQNPSSPEKALSPEDYVPVS